MVYEMMMKMAVGGTEMKMMRKLKVRRMRKTWWMKMRRERVRRGKRVVMSEHNM